jgi:peptide/nickel transport system permease protein
VPKPDAPDPGTTTTASAAPVGSVLADDIVIRDDLLPGEGDGIAVGPLERAPSPMVEPGGSRRGRGRGVAFWLAVAWLVVVVLAAVLAGVLPLPDPAKQDLAHRLVGPFHEGAILGTDGLGRDVLARIVHGARVSLVVSVCAVTFGLLLGGTVGMVVAFFRGWVDTGAMSVFNVLLAFPPLVILLGLVAFAGQSVPALVLVIGFISIPTYARVARATTLTVGQREYVLAARALGATNRRLLINEILPNVILPVAAFGLVSLGVVIVLEGSLAFLGLSVPGVPTWGSMIADGRQHLNRTAHLSLIPSLVLFATVLSINFIGDELRRRFDVKESSL